ncbi:hypothetical protein KY284_007210 [Solanum tuberosum]|nr:hypothetical protein KY284_007210 [Solanum tuberosum]
MTAVQQSAGGQLKISKSQPTPRTGYPTTVTDHLLGKVGSFLRGVFMYGGPVLDCCFHDDSLRLVFNYGREDILGDMMHLFAVLNTHMQLYNYVIFLNGIRQVITSSWDETLKCWDPRGCVLSSIEGQVAMEYFDFSEAGQSKKYYPKFPSRIAALPFSRDGRPLAVASSYTYEEGKKGVGMDSFYFVILLTPYFTLP